jgi:hypothetical protein
MNERQILKQFGITSKPYQDWILRMAKDETIDDVDLQYLALLPDPNVQYQLIRNGYSTNLEKYLWLADLVNAIDLSTQVRRNPNTKNYPNWVSDDFLISLYEQGLKHKQSAFWARKQCQQQPVSDPCDLPLLVSYLSVFNNKKAALKAKKKNTDINKYTYPAFIDTMAQMFPSALKGSFEDNVDQLGTFGMWEVIFPRTMQGSQMSDENSITDWCTVRKNKDGGNLFMDYVGKPTDNKFLYYVRSTAPKLLADKRLGWISIGVAYDDNGAVQIVDQTDGGMTISGDQKAMTDERLQDAFGKQTGEILRAINNHYRKKKGNHPVKEELRIYAENPYLVDQWLNNSRDVDKVKNLYTLSLYEMSPSVFEYAVKTIKNIDDIQLAVDDPMASIITIDELLVLQSNLGQIHFSLDRLYSELFPPEYLKAKGSPLSTFLNYSVDRANDITELEYEWGGEYVISSLYAYDSELIPEDIITLLQFEEDNRFLYKFYEVDEDDDVILTPELEYFIDLVQTVFDNLSYQEQEEFVMIICGSSNEFLFDFCNESESESGFEFNPRRPRRKKPKRARRRR